MALVSGISDRLGSLVHDSVRDDRAEYLRHRTFISGRLVLSLCALVILPPYLALRGAPSTMDALVFSLAMGPMAGALLTGRTGNLRLGQIMCIASMLALAAALSIGVAPIAIAALIWLALAPVEAYLTGSSKIVLASGASALAIALLVLLLRMSGFGLAQAQVSDAASIVMVALAIGYSTLLAMGALRINRQYLLAAELRYDRYRCLSEAIDDLVLRLDRSGAVCFVSANCDRLFGVPPHEFMGRGLFDRIHVADRPAFLKVVTDAASGSGVVTCVVRVRTPADAETGQGVHFAWVELRANKTLVEAADHGVPGNDTVLVVARDVSRLKQHEQSLEAARADAERANSWKDRFVANVSHELRTPLNAIIGFSEILANKDISPTDPAKIREYANIIHESGEHLLSVVNSILDISKIEAGSFDIVQESFDVPSLVENCLDMLRLRADKGLVALKTDLHPSVRGLVADKRSVKQVLINLISNAIKFTPEGGTVEVAARLEGTSLVFVIADNGIGICANELSKLGMPFFQASDNFDRAYEGTGLGLSVVRGLIGLHGGSIRIESAPAVGTRVSIKLPVDGRRSHENISMAAAIEALPLNSDAASSHVWQRDIEVRKIA